jgi:hypothetical protein
MNSPPARATVAHEVTLKADTVGRVVSGAVVWPEASMRDRLGLESLDSEGVARGERRSLVIAATIPPADPAAAGPVPVLLETAFDVDNEGFLVVRGQR